MNPTDYPALTQAITRSLAPLRQSQAGTMQGFGAMTDGALPEKHKELIALGVAIYMGGGPSAMYAAEAVQAWEQFPS